MFANETDKFFYSSVDCWMTVRFLFTRLEVCGAELFSDPSPRDLNLVLPVWPLLEFKRDKHSGAV
jgi:hypothetical protein